MPIMSKKTTAEIPAADAPEPKKKPSVNIPPDLDERLEKLGEAMDRSKRWLVIRAIREYLQREEAIVREEDETE